MGSSRRLNIVERRMLRLLWGWITYLGSLPHHTQYHRVAPIIKFVMRRVLLYRVACVKRNLRRSFPDKSREQRRQICDDYYTYLSEVVVSTMALVKRRGAYNTIFDDDDLSSHNCEARTLRETINDQSWIALTAHLGLWEYLMYWAQFSDQRLLCVYHPLSNRVFDTLFALLRRQSGTVALASNNIGRFIMKSGKRYRDRSYTLGLIADQNPPLLKRNNWYEFLNQQTVFFEGGEKFALKFNLPIYFIYQQRVGRGHYRMCVKQLWDGVESVGDNEITRRYVAMLESTINDDPAIWLWSHRRWKHKRTAENSY